MLGRAKAMPLSAYRDRLSEIMPPEERGQIDAQSYLDVIGYLASVGGARAGVHDSKIGESAWRSARLEVQSPLRASAVKRDADWRAWRGDVGGSGYSAESQIDPQNVRDLKVAWRWSSANFGPVPDGRNIATPLEVEGTLFTTAGITRDVVAIDAASGETIWIWRPQEPKARFDNAPRKGSGRGVSYWESRGDRRILTVTPGFSLVSLDARSGRPDERFGDHGVVDLMQGLRGAPAKGLPDIGSSSPPLVIGDVVVVGPAAGNGLSVHSRSHVKLDVRGYDVRTGRLLWTFHTVPDRGEPGYETWLDGSADYTGNAGVWAPMSADETTGAIYLPVEAPTSDIYGGFRKGANANSSSLVCLDAKSGKVRWARQLVHHDIWDWDGGAMPVLADVRGTEGVRHVVVSVTKQAMLFVFDRNTGEPIWLIEERPVPKSDVPGEVSWPTEPAPSKPAPFDRQGLTTDDLIDFTPALRAKALSAIAPYRLGSFMSPPSLASAADGTKGTISLPSVDGGGNWEGGVFDPDTGLFYVGSMTRPQLLALGPAPAGDDSGYILGPGGAPKVDGLPLIKPPWGRITAIDLVRGERVWSMANADTPKWVSETPSLKGVTLPRTGVVSRAGLLVTKTLLFAGEGLGGGPRFRAHDKATGRIVAEFTLPARQSGLPMTYTWQGRQYIVLTDGDEDHPAELVAFALPN